MSSNGLVFVYGTLKKGGELHTELKSQKARFVAAGKIKGRLFRIRGESYPGALPSASREYIQGELYELEDLGSALRRLDDVEGCDEGLFTRKLVDVWLGSRKVKAWTYFYAQPKNKASRIPSGSFRVKAALRKKAAG
jgi:gamma-glutamylcyclotransferase (GGCT)/AIG2-like uncharacterized protein YtfP